MPTAIITGVDGFCGRRLALRLSQEGGFVVIGIGRRQRPCAEQYLSDYLSADVSRKDEVDRLFSKIRPDYVFHLAGLINGVESDLYATNLLGTIHLLESLNTHAAAARVLLVGSSAEYGTVDVAKLPVDETHPCHPIDAYGLSKYLMTIAALEYAYRRRMKIAVARPFNIIGPGMSSNLVLGAILQRVQIALQKPSARVTVRVGNAEGQRDFVAVEDATDAYVRMLKGEPWGEVFNICSGRPTSIQCLLELVGSLSPRPIYFEMDPALVRASETRILYGTYQKAKIAFGFEPVTTLSESIRAAWSDSLNSIRCD